MSQREEAANCSGGGTGKEERSAGEAERAIPGPSHLKPTYNWQSTKNSVRERFAFLFNNELLSDVVFLVGEQRIPAHRFMLTTGSAVFDAMFNGSFASTSSEIQLPDVEPAAFLELLRFLYCDQVQIGSDTVIATLYTAKKYAVPALEARCAEFLTEHLQADNAFTVLTQAQLFDETQLAGLCMDTIDHSTLDAVRAEGFTDIDMDTLCAVLKRDTLRIHEIQLFRAVVGWAEAECDRQQLLPTAHNKQRLLGKALPLIRFPLMSLKEFAEGPAQSGILATQEVVDLFLHFTLSPKPPVDYSDHPRWCLKGKESSINRFKEVDSRWGHTAMINKIIFTVTRKISIVGFGLYGAISRPAYYQANIQILDRHKNQILGQNNTGFSCDGTANTFRVTFKQAIVILPDICYTACATLKGPPSHFGRQGLQLTLHATPAGRKTYFRFLSSPYSYTGTTVNSGQIPEIIFCT